LGKKGHIVAIALGLDGHLESHSFVIRTNEAGDMFASASFSIFFGRVNLKPKA